MAALLLTSMVWSGHAQEKDEMDLSGEWAFQTDVMDFRRGSLILRHSLLPASTAIAVILYSDKSPLFANIKLL